MYKILLIEDNQNMIDSILENFEDELEYQIDGFQSSHKALKALKNNAYNLILLDYFLERETGDEVLKKIKHINKNIPVCLLTGFSDRITPKNAFVMGIQGYIDKNGSFDQIINSIKTSVHISQQANITPLPKDIFKVRLKEVRTKQGISQKELSEILKVNRATVSAYETGTNLPPVEILVEISKIFKVSTDYLLGLVNYK